MTTFLAERKFNHRSIQPYQPSENGLLPKIISLPPDQWRSSASVDGVKQAKPARRSWFKKIKEKVSAAQATVALATPLARMTVAALVFETGKIVAGLLAPELQPWGVTL